MIAVAPDEDFRLMLALARYAGLRRHELSIQRWTDIDIPNKRMTISSTKTGKPTSRRDSEGRTILIRKDVPIFRELMPHILRAKEMATAGQQLMQPTYPRDMNLDKQMDRCIARAGLQSWDKPWQNMRATRQTELLDQGDQIKIVCQWFGNSPQIAENHYLMIKKQDFDRAVAVGCVPQNVPQTVQDSAGRIETEKMGIENPMNDAVILVVSQDCLPQSYPARTRT